MEAFLGKGRGIFQPSMAPEDWWLRDNRGCLPQSLRVSRESEEARASQATGVTQVCRQGTAQLAGGGAHILSGPGSLAECGLQLFQVTQTQMDRVPGSPRPLGRLWGGCPG